MKRKSLILTLAAGGALLMPTAAAQLTSLQNPNGQVTSTSSAIGTITVPKYCETDIVRVDVSAPAGHQGYYVRIAEFDPVTWSDTNIYHDAWVTTSMGAPNSYVLNGYSPWLSGLGFEPNKYYRVYTGFNPSLQGEDEIFTVRPGPCGGSSAPDNLTDFYLFMPQNGDWRTRTSSSGFSANIDHNFVQPGDVPLPRTDVDGDGLADPLVWRPGPQARFFWVGSSGTGTVSQRQWGTSGDVPISNIDANMDGRDDLVVWRNGSPSGTVFVINSVTQQVLWNRSLGEPGDQIVQDTDLDGDGYNDLVTWGGDDGNWTFRLSSENYATLHRRQWGTAGDIPLGSMNVNADAGDELVVWRPGPTGVLFTRDHTFGAPRNFAIGQAGDLPIASSDFDGDGVDDPAIWRVNNSGIGEFHWRPNSGGPVQTLLMGMTGDVPVQGADFNNDGETDFSVFRPQNGRWLARTRSNSWTLDEAVGDGTSGQIAGHGTYE